MNLIIDIPALKLENSDPVFLISNAVAGICTILVITAIILDFEQYHRLDNNKRKVNSWVETGSMFLYFFLYFLLLKPAAGKIQIPSPAVFYILQLSGTSLLVLGCFFNIKGRMTLKQNWANQVTIYHHHTLVQSGVYRWVRHPLYASLIWMFIGGSLIYAGYFSLLSVFFIFVPMMYYRARQEERLLTSEFSEYTDYKKQTGMFFPKLF